MKISIFKLTYHTIREATEDSKDGTIKKGCELSRTWPETSVVAAQNLDAAVATLPKRALGVKNVLDFESVLYRDIAFNEPPKPMPAAVRGAGSPAPGAASGEKPLDQQLKEKPAGS